MTRRTVMMDGWFNASQLVSDVYPLSEAEHLCALYVTLCVPLFACSALVIAAIWKTPRFHTSGYALVVSMLSAENLALLAWHFLGTVPATLHLAGRISRRQFEAFSLSSALLAAVAYYCTCCHLVFIAVQRFSSVAFYQTYQRTFSMRRIKIVIPLLWLTLPVLQPLGCFFSPCQYYFSLVDFTISQDYLHPVTIAWNAYITIFNAIISLTVSAFYVGFLLKLKKVHQSSTAAPGSTDQAAIERRLSTQMLVVAVWWVFCMISWMLVSNILPLLDLSPAMWKLTQILQTLAIVGMYGMDSILYLCMNKILRQQALSILTLGKIKPAAESVVSGASVQIGTTDELQSVDAEAAGASTSVQPPRGVTWASRGND